MVNDMHFLHQKIGLGNVEKSILEGVGRRLQLLKNKFPDNFFSVLPLVQRFQSTRFMGCLEFDF